MGFEFCKKHLLLCFVLLENFLFSGVLYGWNDLLKLLRTNELFLHKCSQESLKANEGKCLIQENMFTLLYAVCFLTKALSGVITLKLLDHFSIKAVRIVPLCLTVIGGILLGYTLESYPKMVFSGAVLISIAGGQILFCNFSVAELFPRFRCTVISLCCGAFFASHSVFHIFQLLIDNYNMSYRQLFLVWSISATIMFLPMLFLWSDQQPSKRMYASNVARILGKTKHNKKKKYGLLEDAEITDDSDSEKKLVPPSLEPQFSTADLENQSQSWRANVYISSIPFFLHVWWASVLYLTLLNYNKDFKNKYEIPPYHKENTHTDPEIEVLWNLGPFFMFAIAPLSGFILDFASNIVRKETNLDQFKAKRSRSGIWILLLVTLLVLTLPILKMIDSDPTVASTILYIVAYATSNTIAVAYMSVRFPWEIFRDLLSVLWLVTATFSMLEFPLQTLQAIYPGWPSFIMILLMLSSITNVILPWLQPCFKSFESISVISS